MAKTFETKHKTQPQRGLARSNKSAYACVYTYSVSAFVYVHFVCVLL